MFKTTRFALALETLAELAPEIRTARADPAAASLPTLSEVLAEYSPLPQSALFLGLAEDGLPVLLNLRDPVPGPLLIVGDSGSGKTTLLKNIARATDRTHRPDQVKYIVFTEHLNEWQSFDKTINCDGILDLQNKDITNYFVSLTDWAHTNKNNGQAILLLIDGLNTLVQISDLHQPLRWLLLRGTSHNVWPIITLNTMQAANSRTWLDAFRTRLFGSIQNMQEAEALTGFKNISFNELLAGSQFAMREGNDWLPFWLPILD